MAFDFPQISTILSNPTLPANPFLPPTCTPPSQFATFIRITNKLSLTGINLPATLSFELDDPSSPRECRGLPCLPRASRGASKGLFTQCGAEAPPLLLLLHPVYPVYPELRGECRRAAFFSSESLCPQRLGVRFLLLFQPFRPASEEGPFRRLSSCTPTFLPH